MLKKPKKANNIPDCLSFYRFVIEKKDGTLSLNSWNETHSNHPFVVNRTNLTSNMIEDLKHFNKGSSITEVKSYIEKKFKVVLSYQLFYYEFRKYFFY